MEAPEDEKEINSLEGPDTGSSSDTPAEVEKKRSDEATALAAAPKKEKLNRRFQGLITRINIYLLLFILIVVIAFGVVMVSLQQSKRQLTPANLDTQPLSSEELSKISGSDAKVGDAKQTLTIESNAIFAGQALVRGSLDVAGEIKVGAALNVPGLNVSGTSVLGQVAANELTVSGNASIQGQLNIQRNLAVAGSASFGGPVSVPQITVQTMQLNGDLQFNRHIDAGGSTPGKSNGTALGAGGTSSLSGTDTAGTLTINTGSGPAIGCFANITFAIPFNATPHVVITPVGSPGSSISYYVNRSTTGFSICTASPPPPGASFAFDYIVID